MELKIGEVFEYEGKKYQAYISKGVCLCHGCDFREKECWSKNLPQCIAGMREDKENVIFKEIKDEQDH